MKRLLLCLSCAFMLVMISGCADYGYVDDALDKITIEDILPEAEDGGYSSLEEAADAVYEQQLAACKMYAECYEKTYYQQYLGNGKKLKEDKTAHICSTFRREVNTEIYDSLKYNINKIIKDCEEESKSAFPIKVNNDVLGFYDAYSRYLNAESKEDELQNLCGILVNFAQRRNILALSFLERNKSKVYEAAAEIIEGNAETDDEYRYYLNKNNNIVSALNDVYGGVSAKYADRINKATNKLSINLVNSMDTLTDSERSKLMDELNLNSPSPSPTASPKPSASTHPTAVPTPKATSTPTPSPAPTPMRTSAPIVQPTTAPVVQPQVTEEPQPEVTEAPSYSFSVND